MQWVVRVLKRHEPFLSHQACASGWLSADQCSNAAVREYVADDGIVKLTEALIRKSEEEAELADMGEHFSDIHGYERLEFTHHQKVRLGRLSDVLGPVGGNVFVQRAVRIEEAKPGLGAEILAKHGLQQFGFAAAGGADDVGMGPAVRRPPKRGFSRAPPRSCTTPDGLDHLTLCGPEQYGLNPQPGGPGGTVRELASSDASSTKNSSAEDLPRVRNRLAKGKFSLNDSLTLRYFIASHDETEGLSLPPRQPISTGSRYLV